MLVNRSPLGTYRGKTGYPGRLRLDPRLREGDNEGALVILSSRKEKDFGVKADYRSFSRSNSAVMVLPSGNRTSICTGAEETFAASNSNSTSAPERSPLCIVKRGLPEILFGAIPLFP